MANSSGTMPLAHWGLPTHFLSKLCICLLCIMPLAGLYAPRAMAFIPAIVGLLGYIAHRTEQGRFPKFSPSMLIIVLGTISLIALSYLWTMDTDETLKRLSKIIPVFAGGTLFISMAQNSRQDIYEAIARFFPKVMIAAACVLIFELLTEGRFIFAHFHDMERFADVSALNRSVVVIALLGLPALFMATKRAERWTLLALLGIVLALTDSQSVLLGLCIIAVFLRIFPVHRPAAWAALAGSIGVVIITAPFLAQFGFKFLASDMQNIPLMAQAYVGERFEIWDFIARKALEKPWLGHGIEAAKMITDFDIAHTYFPHDSVLHPHNFIMQLWLEFGAIGAVYALSVIGLIIYRLWHTKDEASISAKRNLALLIGIIFIAAVTYGLWQGWWLGMCITVAGLCIVCHKIQIYASNGKA